MGVDFTGTSWAWPPSYMLFQNLSRRTNRFIPCKSLRTSFVLHFSFLLCYLLRSSLSGTLINEALKLASGATVFDTGLCMPDAPLVKSRSSSLQRLRAFSSTAHIVGPISKSLFLEMLNDAYARSKQKHSAPHRASTFA